MDIIFHYPPELFNLLIDTLPVLCKTKKDLLLFFKGAGTPTSLMQDLEQKVAIDRQSISKYDIARTLLDRLNQKGETTLKVRREILKRVTEFEDFSSCWPADHFKAKGLVSEVRRIVNVKDSFTRMRHEKEEEQKKRVSEEQKKFSEQQTRRLEISAVKKDLFSLFGENDAQKRGKLLESVLEKTRDTLSFSTSKNYSPP